MRRFLLLVLGLALVAAGVYLAGRAPSAYVLERECEQLHRQRRERYTLLSFHIARSGPEARADLQRQVDELLRETKTVEIRGWDVVVVPAGARAPGAGYSRAARIDPSIPPDPPALKGPMEVWTRPRGLLARIFAW